jgi:hypothetical protein
MKPVDDKQRSLFCQFDGNAPLSFFDEGRIAKHRTELLRPFIAGDPATQRLEPSTISAREDDSPFMFELFGRSFLRGVAVDRSAWSRTQHCYRILLQGRMKYL